MTLTGFLTYAVALGAPPCPARVSSSQWHALGSGFRTAMAFSAWLILGDLTLLSAAMFGLTLIAETLGEVFIVRLCAGLYRAYLAVLLWRSAGQTDRIEDRLADRPLFSFIAGSTVSLANPKTIVFDLAILPEIVDLRTVTAGNFGAPVELTALVLAG